MKILGLRVHAAIRPETQINVTFMISWIYFSFNNKMSDDPNKETTAEDTFAKSILLVRRVQSHYPPMKMHVNSQFKFSWPNRYEHFICLQHN